jgi:chromosome segregation ATPase
VFKIHLENFMCHENFTMHFGPNVNFISGHNGSGKSAVLQALQCCLGVQARKTGRGTSQANFVRKGARAALAQVVLWNKGSDAYRPDVYGGLIAVEKRIDARQGSRFVLKAEDGRLVGSSRGELDRMLDHLNILVSNPIVVMTQDSTRTFLGGSVSDRNKHELFFRATLLDQVIFNVNTTDQHLQSMRELYQAKVKEVKKKKAELDEVGRQVEMARELEGIKEKSEALQCVLAWKHVKLKEEELAKARHMLTDVGPEQLRKLEGKVRGCEEEARLAQEELVRCQRSIAAYNERYSNEEKKLQDMSTREKQAMRVKMHKENQVKRFHDRVVVEQKKEETYMETLKEAQADEQAATQALMQEQETNVQKQLALKNAKKAAVQEARLDVNKIRAAASAKYDHVQKQSRIVHAAEDRLAQQRQQKQRLELEAKQGQIGKFGWDTQKVHNAIRQNQRMFDREPIGPLGACLRLSDDKWAKAAEAACGRALDMWLVHGAHDHVALKKVLAKAGNLKVSVLVVNFDTAAYNVQSATVSQGWTTLLSVLRCSHKTNAHTVLNALIDSNRVENTALFESTRAAEQAIFTNRTRVEGYTTEGAHIFWRGNSQSTIQPPGRARRARLAADNSTALRECDHQISEEARRLKEDMAAKTAAQEEYASLEADRKEAEAAQESCEEELQRATQFFEEALTQRQAMVNEQRLQASGDLDSEIQKVQAKKADAELILHRAEQELEEHQEQLEAATAAKQNQAEHVQTLVATNQDDEANIEDAESRKKEAEAHLVHYKALQTKFEAQVQKLMRDKEVEEAELEDQVKIAQEICAYENLAGKIISGGLEGEIGDLDMDNIRKLSKKAGRLIAESERENQGSLESLECAHLNLELEVETRLAKLQQVQKPYNALTSSHFKRREKFEHTLREKKKTVSFNFNRFMAKRGFTGACKFDDIEGKLTLNVRMNNKAQRTKAHRVNDMKSLSGGERSFSTLAFALALGLECDSPFRASDEFDVFMDVVARQLSLKTLVEFAHDKKEFQFIFLTPQDISAVDDVVRKINEGGDLESHVPEHFVKVIQMKKVRA